MLVLIKYGLTEPLQYWHSLRVHAVLPLTWLVVRGSTSPVNSFPRPFCVGA